MMSTNSRGKFILLAILFVLPVSVYVFFKLFGKNHYTLPVVELKESIGDTLFFITKGAGSSGGDNSTSSKPTVYNWGCLAYEQSAKNAFAGRLYDIFSERGRVEIVSVDTNEFTEDIQNYFPASKPDGHIWRFSKVSLVHQIDSIGFVNVESDGDTRNIPRKDLFMLMDGEGVIRGFYDSKEEKEFDRLVLELEVLLYE